MRRTIFALTERQKKWLSETSAHLGLSVTAFLRSIINERMEKDGKPEPEKDTKP